MADTQMTPPRPIQVGGYGYIRAVLCVGLCMIATLASAEYTYYTIDATFPQLPVVQGTYVTGLTDKGTMVGLYKDQAGLKSWIWRSDKKIFQKVLQSGWVSLRANDVNSNFKIIGSGYRNDVQKSWLKKESVFTVLRTPDGYEVKDCTLTSIDSDAVCMYFDQELEMLRGVGIDTKTRVVGPPIDLEIPDRIGWYIGGINNKMEMVGRVYRLLPDGSIIVQGFHRSSAESGAVPVVTLIDGPCGTTTMIQDINDAGLMAATCFDEVNTNDLSYAYDGVTWTPLRVPSSIDTVVHRVNNLGHFAGSYEDITGKIRGFVAQPWP